MNARNMIVALSSALAGALVVVMLYHPASPNIAVKSDRLSGEQTETAFLPERFGVPSSSQ